MGHFLRSRGSLFSEESAPESARIEAKSGSLGPSYEPAPHRSGARPLNSQQFQPLRLSRNYMHITRARPAGFEPATYGSGGGSEALPVGSSDSQPVGNVRGDDRERVQPSHPIAAVRSPFAAPVLQPGGDAPVLLSVRDAAARLGVCTATIYKLCENGALAHVRVLNSIRIASADLVAFIQRNTSVSREAVSTGCQSRGRAGRPTQGST